jgi:hypothetical protein
MIEFVVGKFSVNLSYACINLLCGSFWQDSRGRGRESAAWIFFLELRGVDIDSEEDRPVRREERLFGGKMNKVGLVQWARRLHRLLCILGMPRDNYRCGFSIHIKIELGLVSSSHRW